MRIRKPVWGAVGAFIVAFGLALFFAPFVFAELWPPYLGMQDLRDVQHAVEGIENKTAKSRGFILRRVPVNSRMTILTLYPFGNH